MVATGSPRRPSARSNTRKSRGSPRETRGQDGSQEVAGAALQREPAGRSSPPASSSHEGAGDEILERAARLGITSDRVLQEYARIAFADLRRVAHWGAKGFTLKAGGDTAAISEIVGSGRGGYRVKLYDKKAALDAIARHLGLFVRGPQHEESTASSKLAENAREVLARRLARLASGSSEK